MLEKVSLILAIMQIILIAIWVYFGGLTDAISAIKEEYEEYKGKKKEE